MQQSKTYFQLRPSSEQTIVLFVLACSLIPLKAFSQTNADSLLLQQISAEMNTTTETAAPPARSSLNFNPDMGVIGDFRTSYISDGDRHFDAELHETEISLQSVVDPYARADFFISFGRNPETHEYSAEIEEGYLSTLSLPWKLQLKVGKFKEAMGRINPTHAHALPFIDLPDAYVNYFGEEGLNDEGLSLSWLTPNPLFYQELTFQATSGISETPAFARSNGDQFIYLGHLKNFFALNDNATLELGLTGISGPNDSSALTNIAALDLTYKWKPVQMNTYHSVTWQSELFYSHDQISEDAARTSMGLYSYLQTQIAKRWFLTGRYDYAQQPQDKSIVDQSYSLTAGWYATEFQKLEFEAKTTNNGITDQFYTAWLRWIFVMGAHGAHQY